ncbi:MAG TPA: DUF177 domain-containing protein [Thermoanaerobaculia bacterium]|nr:DUF177 domain-containing protein [Thermoanaerobaculia bacterium]
MRLHLDRERDEPLLWEESVVLEPAALGPELIVELTPIEVRGRVDLIGDDAGESRGGGARSRAAAAAAAASFQVAMDLRYGQALACTRCLQPVRSEVTTHAEIMVTARPKPTRAKEGGAAASGTHARGQRPAAKKAKAHAKEPASEPEVELEKDELGAIVIEGEHLDTEPLIAEQILLEIPMKPLCAPECRGLCPRCGADRNAVADCCEEPAGDERWEALGALRDRLSADGR